MVLITMKLIEWQSLVQIIIPMTTNLSWLLPQLDVKNAFLCDDFKDVYMISLGLVPKIRWEPMSVEKKALHRLKQSSQTGLKG